MKNQNSRLAAALLAIGTALAVAVLFLPGPQARSEGESIIDPSEIQPGMKGYGLSVFKGGQIERFEVEVVDVVPDFLPKQDIILVMCSGQNLEKTMVVAGMSGSPVWIEGRLAGAIAYGWSFSNDPLAGVTPIKYMRELMKAPVSAPQAGAAPRVEIAQNGPTPDSPFPQLAPIATPLIVSGVGPAGLEELRAELAKYNLIPVAGGGMSSFALDTTGAENLVPGAALGGALMLGDISLVGTGTLTWREGNFVSAFGHPFLQGGAISMPMVSAKIHTIVSGQAVSFKLASPTAVVGEIFADEQAAIAGEIGREPPTIPIRIKIENPKAGIKDEFNLAAAKLPAFIPVLLRIALLESINKAIPTMEPSTIRSRARLKISGHGQAEYEDVYLSRRLNFTMGYFEPVLYFLGNPFEKVTIDALEFDLTVTDGLQAAFIDSVRLDRDEASPGDTVEAIVTLRVYNGENVERRFPFQVPLDADMKSLQIMVAGGANTPPDAAMPEDVEGMIKFMNALYSSDELVLFYKVPESGVDVGSHRLDSLPPSVSSVLTPPNLSRTKANTKTVYQAQTTPYVIVGAQRIKLAIDGDSPKPRKKR